MTEQPEGPELKRLVETCATAAQKFVPMTGDPLHDEIAEAQRLVLQALLLQEATTHGVETLPDFIAKLVEQDGLDASENP
jgi:hypothetical protein